MHNAVLQVIVEMHTYNGIKAFGRDLRETLG